MKLNLKKINQGPVLAKGATVPVSDGTNCGVVDVNGSSMGGCVTTTNNGNGNVSYGVSPSNGGSAGVQYSYTGNCC